MHKAQELGTISTFSDYKTISRLEIRFVYNFAIDIKYQSIFHLAKL
jgi:hypothetical protein